MKIFPVLIGFLIFLGIDAQATGLSLENMLELAGKQNPTLKAAAQDKRIAAEDLTQAKGDYLPTVDFSGGYTAQKDAQRMKTEHGYQATEQTDFGFFALTADQTLYDFGRTSARVESAKALQNAVEYDYRGTEQGIFLQTVEAYYRILTMQRVIQAADEEVQQMEDHLRVAKNLFEQGVVTRNDVLQAEVQLADSRQQQLADHNGLENAWLRLNYLTGRDPDQRDELQETAVFPSVTEELDPHRAVAERPELQAQQMVLRAGEQDVAQSRSRFWPEIFARAGVNYLENKYLEQQTGYSLTMGLRINLFDGFTTSSRLRQALATETRNRDRLRDLQQQAELEYRTARNDVRIACKRIEVTRKAILQGEENLRINKSQYLEQVGTATEVIDAQTLLTRTRFQNYQAMFDYEVALARMKRAAGEL